MCLAPALWSGIGYDDPEWVQTLFPVACLYHCGITVCFNVENGFAAIRLMAKVGLGITFNTVYSRIDQRRYIVFLFASIQFLSLKIPPILVCWQFAFGGFAISVRILACVSVQILSYVFGVFRKRLVYVWSELSKCQNVFWPVLSASFKCIHLVRLSGLVFTWSSWS